MTGNRRSPFDPKPFGCVVGGLWLTLALSTLGYQTLNGWVGWQIIAAMSGFVSVIFTLFGLPMVWLRAWRQKRIADRGGDVRSGVNNSGEPYVSIRPANHVQGVDLLLGLVLGLPAATAGSVGGWVCALLLLIAVVRVVFAMRVVVTHNEVKVVRFSKTVRIERENVLAVWFTESERPSIHRSTWGRSAALTIFGADYEPFPLPLYESNVEQSRRFARASTVLLERSSVTPSGELLERAIRLHRVRARRAANAFTLVNLPILVLVLGSIGFREGLAATSSTWVLAMLLIAAIAVTTCCAVAVRVLWRRYRIDEAWVRYAPFVETSGSEHELSPEIADQLAG